MLTQFSLYPIQRIARHISLGGIDDEHFDSSILPKTTVEGATIEDVSAVIREGEFEFLRGHYPNKSIKELEAIKYAIIHRAADFEDDGKGGFVLANELLKRSENIVAEIAACLRLIRPTSQKTQICSGAITRDGAFSTRHLNDPLTFVNSPQNQVLFTIRTSDIKELLDYAPLFRAAMHGPYWKFRMAVQLHEAGHFQNTEWKARYFLWTSALESLFTSNPTSNRRQHSGSLVASERIMEHLGANTSIYPSGELTSLQADPGITVQDVIGDLYCLRNHIAHGDKVPDYYYEPTNRVGSWGALARNDMLMEAISFIVRRSILKILRDGLLHHFQDGPSSEAYFTAKGLTLRQLPQPLQYYCCKL
jgi:hypothetical protein